MAKFSQRPTAKTKHPIGIALVERIPWDDLRVLVVVARTLSFRKAATALRAAPATVLRRIERLEGIFGFRLFDRLTDGLALTAEGRAVYASAQEMELASHKLRAHLDEDLTTRGMVRCSVTEGLGTAWILPQLAQFCRTHPTTIVDLRCAMEVADVLHMEADVAVQLQRPGRADAKIGALPTYVMTLGTDLVPVDIGVRHQLDIWMTYHPDARSVRRVSVFIDWLRTLFDPRRHPWFADDFIHPRDLMGTAPPADISATPRTLVPAPARAAKAG